MIKLRDITSDERQTHCQAGHCLQYADVHIILPTKQVKMCRSCIAKLAVELCRYGIVRRAVVPVIEEKGL